MLSILMTAALTLRLLRFDPRLRHECLHSESAIKNDWSCYEMNKDDSWLISYDCARCDSSEDVL